MEVATLKEMWYVTKLQISNPGSTVLIQVHRNKKDNQHALKSTCKAWELKGIPCCHVVCAMYHDRKNLEAYVSPWYNKEKYVAAYS
ncbi:hypothetical protein GOBAR_DD12276 [Gossypium barbadense]|nr:hypothetical protein GOBAR_DD12276 [Gossypium barbadense]